MLQDNVQLETRRVHFGREDILERIEQCFKKSKIVCLLGVPGIGKASTAIEYGKKSKSKRSLIIRFFNCDSEDKLLSEFQGLACELKIGNEIREKRILINICYQKLANLPKIVSKRLKEHQKVSKQSRGLQKLQQLQESKYKYKTTTTTTTTTREQQGN